MCVFKKNIVSSIKHGDACYRPSQRSDVFAPAENPTEGRETQRQHEAQLKVC